MKVAIIQSNYIPWKGYFDIVHDVDLFVFYDDVQYTVRDWRNRNKIKGHDGEHWLTVPVPARSRDLTVGEVTLPEAGWAASHWKTITYYYAKAPYFERYRDFFTHIYLERQWQTLSELNQFVIIAISRDLLGIDTRFARSEEFSPVGTKQDRLLDILGKVGATSYISGPAARAYLQPSSFEAVGMSLFYKEYDGYPEYPQAGAPFAHGVSILDLLFWTGPAASDHIWGWREQTRRIPVEREVPATTGGAT